MSRFQLATRAVVLGLVLSAWVLSALGEETSARSPGRFKLLTWNIQMLPTAPPVEKLKKQQALRAPWIVEYLNAQDYDILVLEEVIDKTITEQLKRGLQEQYPHQVAAEAKRGFSGTSGGILFASRIPIKYVHHIVYKHVSGVDGLAEKGCLLVEGNLDGRRFQIAGTHLQAGDKKTNAKEVGEIFEGILKPFRTEGVPQFLAGDMNIDKGTDRYRALLETTAMRDAPIDDPSPFSSDAENSWTKRGKEPSHIDHILFHPRGTGTTIARQTIQRARREHEGRVMDLANHYGVVAEVQLQP